MKNKIVVKTRALRNLLLLLTMLGFWGCATISSFDQYAYAQTTALKVDALQVMDMATDSFALHQKAVADLKINLQKVYEYEKNRPKNEITLQQWDLLLNPEGHLLGGFLQRWEKSSKLGATFVVNAKQIVSDAFDQISGLESHKLKSSDIPK